MSRRSNGGWRRNKTRRHRRNSRSKASRTLWFRRYRSRMNRGVEHCRLCGRSDVLTFEHLVAVEDGGRFSLDNLTILCFPCNQASRDVSGLNFQSLAEEEARAPPGRRWSKIPTASELQTDERKLCVISLPMRPRTPT